MEYRDEKQGDKTGMTWACDAVVQWDDCYIFKLTFLAHVNFTPHKPYIVATLTHDMRFE